MVVAVYFGPQPRDYSFKLNKKLKGHWPVNQLYLIKQKITASLYWKISILMRFKTKSYVQFTADLNVSDVKTFTGIGHCK